MGTVLCRMILVVMPIISLPQTQKCCMQCFFGWLGPAMDTGLVHKVHKNVMSCICLRHKVLAEEYTTDTCEPRPTVCFTYRSVLKYSHRWSLFFFHYHWFPKYKGTNEHLHPEPHQGWEASGQTVWCGTLSSYSVTLCIGWIKGIATKATGRILMISRIKGLLLNCFLHHTTHVWWKYCNLFTGMGKLLFSAQRLEGHDSV